MSDADPVPAELGHETERQSIGTRIHYYGQTYVAEPEMAEIFIKRAARIVRENGAELVYLRHVDGVDSLLISRGVPLSMEEIVPEHDDDVAALREQFRLKPRR